MFHKFIAALLGGRLSIDVKIVLLHSDARVPFKSNPSDACYDVVAVSYRQINDRVIEYDLGFAVELPLGTQLDLRPRSSIYKTGMVLANSIGTGDELYRRGYKAVFYDVLPDLPNYQPGDKVVQIQIPSYRHINWIVVDSIEETQRGGFGSTGK